MDSTKQQTIEEKFQDALLTLQSYIDFLIVYESEIKSGKAIIDFVINSKNKNSAMVEMLKNFGFPVFGKLQKYLKQIKSNMRKFIMSFKDYMQSNQMAKIEICEKIEVLKPLIDKYEVCAEKEIERCFNYIKAQCEDENSIDD